MQKKTLFQKKKTLFQKKKNPALFDNNTILPNMFQFFFASYLPTYIDSRRIPSLHPLPTMYKMNSYGFRKVFFKWENLQSPRFISNRFFSLTILMMKK